MRHLPQVLSTLIACLFVTTEIFAATRIPVIDVQAPNNLSTRDPVMLTMTVTTPSTCYQLAGHHWDITENIGNRNIYLHQMAWQNDTEPCHRIIEEKRTVINLGFLPEGVHAVYDAETNARVGTIDISSEGSQAAFKVDDAQIFSDGVVQISGEMLTRCGTVSDIEVTINEGLVNIRPILSPRQRCGVDRSEPWSKSFEVQTQIKLGDKDPMLIRVQSAGEDFYKKL